MQYFCGVEWLSRLFPCSQAWSKETEVVRYFDFLQWTHLSSLFHLRYQKNRPLPFRSHLTLSTVSARPACCRRCLQTFFPARCRHGALRPWPMVPPTRRLSTKYHLTCFTWSTPTGTHNLCILYFLEECSNNCINLRYQFPPMNPLWHGLLGFTIGVLGVVSVTGNGMVIYIFSGQKVIESFGLDFHVFWQCY